MTDEVIDKPLADALGCQVADEPMTDAMPTRDAPPLGPACGRGRAKEWRVAHEEVQRIKAEGLLPLQ